MLLTDIVMPEMDGAALIDEAAKRHPGLTLAVMSGSLTPEIEQRLRNGPYQCRIIRKPFTAELLHDAVSRRR